MLTVVGTETKTAVTSPQNLLLITNNRDIEINQITLIQEDVVFIKYTINAHRRSTDAETHTRLKCMGLE